MLKKEKELIMDFIGNPKILAGVSMVFAVFVFGAYFSYYDIETPIDQKQLVDVYAKHLKMERGNTSKSSFLTFKSTTEKEITFHVESKYVKSYDRSYLFSFDKEDKVYKLKVLKTELDHAKNGDAVNVYSILDEKPILDETRIYLTLEEYKKTKKVHYLGSFQTFILLASIFFVWVIILLLKRKQVIKHNN